MSTENQDPKPAAKWQPNAEQAALLRALLEEQTKEKSASEFTRKFLPFSPERWSKITAVLDEERPRSYFDDVQDRDAVFSELEMALREIRIDRARPESLGQRYELTHFRAVAQAVRECRSGTGRNRIIKYLAPTGGGKTELCRFLVNEFGASMVETREAWRRSYFTVLEDICRALKVRLNGESRPATIEAKLIEALSDKKRILCLDEAEFFGASALNGLKLLINKTRVTIVLCAIPAAHDRWNRHFPVEADQIATRTHGIYELGAVDVKDAGLFFAANQFADREASLKLLAQEASVIGHYSFLQRVADCLKGDTRAEEPAVRKAITKARKQMVREGGAK